MFRVNFLKIKLEKKEGQVLLITVFTLTFALFAFLIILTPIRDKIVRISEVENVYKAIAEAEKGLELGRFWIHRKTSTTYFDLNIYSIATNSYYCGGLKISCLPGTCQIYKSSSTLDVSVTYYYYIFTSSSCSVSKDKVVSEGFKGNLSRTIMSGSLR